MNSLSDIYQQYAPDVYRFALGLSGDSALADDITAETFVRVLVSAKPIEMETVKGYLFTIARNLYLEGLRKSKRLTDLDDSLTDRAYSVEGITQRREELNKVLSGLQQLPEIDRAALLMRVEYGMAYTAVAETLNISLSAAKVKIHRARIKLAKLMMENEQ
ncbi:MAG: RNA polymerase sigma factor [Chloroflexota bacterium]